MINVSELKEKTNFTDDEINQLVKLDNYVSPFNLDRYGEARVCYLATIQKICSMAETLNFSQKGEDVVYPLKNNLAHVLTLKVFDHKNGDEFAPMHHRVLAQLHDGSLEPQEVLIDVLAGAWEKLPLASEFVKVLDLLKDNDNKILTMEFTFQKNGTKFVGYL